MPAIADPRPLTQFRALASAGKIDLKTGIIYGASVITCGPALGHGVTVDEKGLKQCLEACEAFGDEGVKVILDHESGFQEIVGAAKNFRISGIQLLSDIYLLDSAPSREQVLEIGQKLPRNIGLSVETYGQPEKKGNDKFWRVDSIDAIALVPNPAANPKGLFSKRSVDNNGNSKSSTPHDMELAEFKTAFAELIKPVTDKLAEVETKLNDKTEGDKLSAKVDGAVTKLEALPTETKIGEIVKEKVDAAVKEQASQIAADAVTKFAATIGLKKAPDGQLNDPNANKTSFSAKIATHLSAGAKDRATAIVRAKNDDPVGYSEWVKAGSPDQ